MCFGKRTPGLKLHSVVELKLGCQATGEGGDLPTAVRSGSVGGIFKGKLRPCLLTGNSFYRVPSDSYSYVEITKGCSMETLWQELPVSGRGLIFSFEFFSWDATSTTTWLNVFIFGLVKVF